MSLYEKPALIRSVAVPYETIWMPPLTPLSSDPTLPIPTLKRSTAVPYSRQPTISNRH
jgi:hypothetical protein